MLDECNYVSCATPESSVNTSRHMAAQAPLSHAQLLRGVQFSPCTYGFAYVNLDQFLQLPHQNLLNNFV